MDWIADSMRAGPGIIGVKPEEPWESIALLHKHFLPKLLLGVFPSYLQVDTRYYRAVRSIGMSSLCVAQEQMQAGLALIKPLSIGGIVTTQGALPALLNDLPTFAPGSTPYLQILLSPDERPIEVPGYRAFFEVHAAPGLPLLYQCPHRTTGFHPAQRFSADLFSTRVTMTDCACPCGSTTLAHY